ncbi:MAG: hypothetical protein ACKN95_08835 [Holophagaceae bacterium]
MKNLAVLGSTGSIGQSTLEVVKHPSKSSLDRERFLKN